MEMRGDSPQYALDRLEPQRIRLARERLGLTGKELAQKIGKTPSSVSQYENGVIKPDLDTLVRISFALEVPTLFFSGKNKGANYVALDECHFRANRSATQKERRQSKSKGQVLIEILEYFESKGIEFPSPVIPDNRGDNVSADDIEDIAVRVRSLWGMGVGPIPNIVKLLESHGVFVLSVPASSSVDAYSFWYVDRPCIVLVMDKTPSRARFDAAHELGHLVLHDDVTPGDSALESEANRFAAAFLAPREGFIEECPTRWSLRAFKKLKFRWRISIQALVRRAYDLGKFSRSTYTRAMKEISAKGMRKNEGPEWEMEKPIMVEQAISLLSNNSSIKKISEAINVFPWEVEERLSAVVPHATLAKLKSEPNQEAKIVKMPRSE